MAWSDAARAAALEARRAHLKARGYTPVEGHYFKGAAGWRATRYQSAVATRALRKHPMYTVQDRNYFLAKGYNAAEIKAFWDRDYARGVKPLKGNKNYRPGHSSFRRGR